MKLYGGYRFFPAEEGKVTGIVGESGSGKSTAMLAVMGLLDHKAAVEAEKVSLFGNTVRAGDNAAIIFQDPLKCLNPTVKIGRQIAETVRNRKKLYMAGGKEKIGRTIGFGWYPPPQVKDETISF